MGEDPARPERDPRAAPAAPARVTDDPPERAGPPAPPSGADDGPVTRCPICGARDWRPARNPRSANRGAAHDRLGADGLGADKFGRDLAAFGAPPGPGSESERNSRAGGLAGSPDEAWSRCGHCGLALAPGSSPRACAGALQARLVPGPLARAGPEAPFYADPPFHADAYTIRTAALGRGLAYEPGGRRDAAALAFPHAARAPGGTLRALPPAPPRVALAMIVAEAELPGLAARLGPILHRFVDALVVVDRPTEGGRVAALPDLARATDSPATDSPATDASASDASASGASAPALRALARPLDGDFGAQRCVAQRAARASWVLQIDADEWPEPALLDAMDALTALADRQGLRSLGLPRRNMVDGRRSDLWPDIQYRLNRREVRFRGAVHERPDAPGGWRRTTLALDGPIDHHLDRARVEERSRAYEAMAPGGGRPADERALLRPFRP